MRYVVYGAGGIGGGIGAQLQGAGHDVTLIARGDHLRAIQEGGLIVKTPEGVEAVDITAVSHPSELVLGGDEVFLFTMKSQDTAAALQDLRAAASTGAPVVMAQNGVANERMAARLFDRVYGMLVYMPAQFLEAGTVVLHATPRRGTLHAGRFPAGTDEAIERICADLREAGFESDPTSDIMPVKYGKLLMNLGNGAQALCGLDADLKGLMRDLRREAMGCFDAAGIDFLTAKELVARLGSNYEMGTVEGSSRQGGSSWQGLVRGTGSIESDYLNGEIVLLGRLHGFETPLNSAVQELSQEAAREGRPPGEKSVADIVERAKVAVS